MAFVQSESADQQNQSTELVALAGAGNANALCLLWEQNRGLIRSMVWRWYSKHKAAADAHGFTADDFEQEGFFAIQYAASNYNPQRGPFTACLDWAIKRQISTLMRGAHVRMITGDDGRKRQISAEPIDSCLSLDEYLEDEEGKGNTRGDLIPDPAAKLAFDRREDIIFNEQMHEILEKALATLPPREAQILRGRYYDGLTLRRLGKALGVSSARAGELERLAIRKLRGGLYGADLRKFHDEILGRAYHGTGWSTWAQSGSVQERIVEHMEATGVLYYEQAVPDSKEQAAKILPDQK